MGYLLLIIVNIIIATLFFVILRLKFEKSIPTYRIDRVRREMDEIIREFNATAERNISILENRIAIMKRLLVDTGTQKSVDINVCDYEEKRDSNSDNLSVNCLKSSFDDNEYVENIKEGIKFSEKNILKNQRIRKFKQGNAILSMELLPDLFRKIFYVFKILKRIVKGSNKNRKVNINNYNNLIVSDNFEADIKNKLIDEDDEKNNFTSNNAINIQNYLLNEDRVNYDRESNTNMSEKEISSLFIASDDKYYLIFELYNQGYTIDVISRCSGIPEGEVKLVLDLNNSI